MKKETNEGFAPACNLGFSRAKHPVILLLNNDVRVEANLLSHLVPHFSDPTVFAVCCRAFDMQTNVVATAGKVGEFKRGFWRVHANYDVNSGQWTVDSGQLSETSDQRPATSDYYSILASGGFSAFDAEKLRQLGGFNSLLAPFYWEDVDLSLRAWKRGWKILYEPQAVVYHATSSTIGSHFDRRQIEEIAQRNRLITHWINLHDPLWLAEHIVVVALLLLSSVFTLNLAFWRAWLSALKQWPAIRQQRRQERRASHISDRQLARLMATVSKQKVFALAVLFVSLFAAIACDRSPDQPTQAPRVAPVRTDEATANEKKQLAKRYTSNAEAYQAYLQGLDDRQQRTGQGLEKAITYFQQAIEADARFAPAYADLADCYLALANYESRPPKEFFPKARQAAIKALRLDDSLAQAHATLASVRLRYDWDWAGAENAFQRALELNPNQPLTHQWYSEFLSALGRHDEALAAIKRAQELDPWSPIIAAQVGLKLYYAHQYDQAIEPFRKALELDATSASAIRDLGLVYLQKGLYQEAITQLQRAVEFSGNKATAALLAHAYAVAGQRAEAMSILNNLIASAKQHYASPYGIAIVYAGLGDNEKTFQWLKKAYEQRALPPSFFKVHPLWDRWRSDSRFVALVRRVGLAP
jgi:GT2 family glycosyltransferase/Tfp pilus assembly protein PilF